MLIISVNNVQSQYAEVREEARRRGEVELAGYRVRDMVQLLEGSNRMAAAIELGLPIRINLLDDNDIMEHDIDDTRSKVTGLGNRATAYEVALSIALDLPRYHLVQGTLILDCPVYDTEKYSGIEIYENGTRII